jgi:hypothetical protein
LKGINLSTIFAVNQTSTHISLKAGYAVVPADGYLHIALSDRDHPDFQEAEAKNWISYSEIEPQVKAAKPLQVISSISDAMGGMTEAELKASNAAAEAPRDVGTVTQLGADTSAEAPADETADETADAAVEKKASRGKKAAE